MKLIIRMNSILIATAMLFANCSEGSKKIAEKAKKPLNIILLIGDGMGLSQISAASFIYNGLNLELFENIGLVKTSSADDYITDSAAGATAYSTGEKSYNGAIGVGMDSLKRTSIVELAEKNGLLTGLVATCSITHATPAAFYAHQSNREMHKEIAGDLYGSGVDFAAGGGKPYFDMEMLAANDYMVHGSMMKTDYKAGTKHIFFYGDSADLPKAAVRGNWLKDATESAIGFLENGKNGFFLMVEGSQIDWGGHDNDFAYMHSELKDFDMAVASALSFAKAHGNTLVIVTADHETGGLSLNSGDLKNRRIDASFASTHHSGTMVPVFAFGPGSEAFRGVMENTAIFSKIRKLYGF